MDAKLERLRLRVRTDGLASNLSMISFVGSDMAETCFGLPGGQPFAGGGGAGVAAFWITAVGMDVASVAAREFLAVTRSRRVLPTLRRRGCMCCCARR